MQRNKRCLLTYFHQRLQRIKALRWVFGLIIPGDINVNLCEPEMTFFNTYSKSKSFQEITNELRDMTERFAKVWKGRNLKQADIVV